MNALYSPSLVWVCLACGQLAPYHTSPTDLMDSAAAMDLSLAPPPSTPTHHLPSMLLATSHHDSFSSPGEMRHSSPQGHRHQHQNVEGSGIRITEQSNNWSSHSNSGEDDRSANLTRRHAAHSHGSHSREDGYSCLNDESDSYLSMAAASHHRHQCNQHSRHQQHHLLQGEFEDSFGDGAGQGKTLTDELARQHLFFTSSPLNDETNDPTGTRKSPSRSGHPSTTHNNNNNNSNGHSRHVSHTGTASMTDPMQSLAALLMEEHLVGSREMRFCEGCREVRCAEIRQAADVMPPSPDVAIAGASMNKKNEGRMDTRRGEEDNGFPPQQSPLHSSRSHFRETMPLGRNTVERNQHDVRHGGVAGLFATPYTDPARPGDGADKRDGEATSNRMFDPSSSPVRPPAASSAHARFASAGCGEPHRKHDIPSVHLVVALSIARMVVKLKNAAVTLITNFHPLSPSLPTACRASPYVDGDNGNDDGDEHRHQQGNKEVDRFSCDSAAPDRQHRTFQTSTARATPPPPNSCERVAGPFPGTSLSSLNSSLNEINALGGVDSNGISYTSFTTAPSQEAQPPLGQHSPKQHSWSSQDYLSPGEDHQSSGERGRCQGTNPVCVAAHAPLLYPDTAPALHTADPIPLCTTAVALLRSRKEKWNSINVREALWRLVLPSFSTPFITTAPSMEDAPLPRCGSAQSTPQRRTETAMENTLKPYRGFRGEVEDAVGQLDSMQLEVAKLRLKQVLAEIEAEQSRREGEASA